MKKLLILIMIVLLTGLFAVACSDDDTGGASAAAFSGKTWTRSSTEGLDSETKSYTFSADGTYVYNGVYTQSGSSSYEYKAGTWAVEGGNLVTIATQEGSSSTSGLDAVTNSSPITEANRQKDVYSNPIVSGTKLALNSSTGGDTSTLKGTWGSLTSANEQTYRMKDSAWTLAKESFLKITLTDAATNYQMINKRYYDDEGSSWLTTPEYRNEATGSWTNTAYTNTFPITAWELLGAGKIKIEISGGMMVMTNDYITSGSALGFDPYTEGQPN